MDSASRQPIEFVNIGIVGKNIGTVSNSNGEFSIDLDVELDHDSLLFSSHWLQTRLVKIADSQT